MKKIICSILILFVIACKQEKETPEPPVAKDCVIQKISNNDGSSFTYQFDANNRLDELTYVSEVNGQKDEVVIRYAYNAAGNLLKVTNTVNYIDNYFYDANGALTRIDFLDPDGQIYEQFTIKTDAQKRITNITTIDEVTATYEYNGPGGVFSKSVAMWDSYMVAEYLIKSYETDNSKKRHSLAIKGHPFDPRMFTNEMIYSIPLNFNPPNYLILTEVNNTQWDENWENLTPTTRAYWDATYTYQYNSNGYMTRLEQNDKVFNEKYLTSYTYANCN